MFIFIGFNLTTMNSYQSSSMLVQNPLKHHWWFYQCQKPLMKNPEGHKFFRKTLNFMAGWLYYKGIKKTCCCYVVHLLTVNYVQTFCACHCCLALPTYLGHNTILIDPDCSHYIHPLLQANGEVKTKGVSTKSVFKAFCSVW
jgi:hypothetical protein